MELETERTLSEQVARLERDEKTLRQFNVEYSDFFSRVCRTLGLKDMDPAKVVPMIEDLQRKAADNGTLGH